MISVYMLFFLNNTFANKKEDVNSKDVKEIKIKDTTKNQTHKTALFCKYKHHAVSAEKYKSFSFQLLPRVNILRIYPAKNILNCCLLFCLFKRPPPILL